MTAPLDRIFPPRKLPAEPTGEPPPGGFRVHFPARAAPYVESRDKCGERDGQSLLHALETHGRRPGEACALEDGPAFRRRGFMLDVSRDRVPTPEWTEWLVDRLAELRFNELQLYTEHTFAYRGHERVWARASPWTAEEIGRLDAHCRRRAIELVPNQNTFGHMERWLRRPEYRHLAECPEGFVHPATGRPSEPTTLCPTDESLAFVDGLLGELLPRFSSRRVNVGGDEPWELGLGRSRARVEADGKHRVYFDFLKRVLACATERGKTPQVWADVILERPEWVREIPGEAIPAIWGYTPGHPFAEQCRAVAEAGFAGRFTVVPGTQTWNAFAGRLDDARANICRAAREGRRCQAEGFLLTAWGDLGHHAPYATLYPPLVLGAQAAWGAPVFNPATADGGEETKLAEAVDAAFFPDRAPGAGASLVALARAENRLPAPANTSLLHLLTVRQDERAEACLAGVDARALETVEAIIANTVPPDADRACDGVAATRELALWATRCAMARKAGASPPDASRAVDRFERNWRRESRPDGLEDSLRKLDPNVPAVPPLGPAR